MVGVGWVVPGSCYGDMVEMLPRCGVVGGGGGEVSNWTVITSYSHWAR